MDSHNRHDLFSGLGLGLGKSPVVSEVPPVASAFVVAGGGSGTAGATSLANPNDTEPPKVDLFDVSGLPSRLAFRAVLGWARDHHAALVRAMRAGCVPRYYYETRSCFLPLR